MQSVTPSGLRRIWAKKPLSKAKREPARSSSFNAWMVATMYSTVRSNSLRASGRVLPISHMSNRTTSSRTACMRGTKASTQRMRSATDIVGHSPQPLSQARTAASSARRL